MTGPEHYQRAEQIVAELEASAPYTPVEWHVARSAQAQVHATLALAAAQAEPWLYDTDDRTGSLVRPAWVEALS